MKRNHLLLVVGILFFAIIGLHTGLPTFEGSGGENFQTSTIQVDSLVADTVKLDTTKW